jgi:hypothetical protein
MADIWRNPIFDRMSHDVSFAIQQIEAWKERHTHSTDVNVTNDSISVNAGEVSTTDKSVIVRADGIAYVENDVLYVRFGGVYDLKGCLNLSDITRIEDNISYLAKRLTQYRYSINVNSKEWVGDSLPTEQDMKRIGDNIRSIFNGFVKPSESAVVPETMLSYEDINELERNLHQLKMLLDAMVNAFVLSGTSKSGTTNRLPIRR